MCRRLLALGWLLLVPSVSFQGPSSALTSPRRQQLPRSSAFDDVPSKVDYEDDEVQEEPWTWPRRMTSGVALLGVCETGFLTYKKIVGGLSCGSSECASVLTGPYSSVFGIPVAFLGFLAYLTVLGLSAAPLAQPTLDRRTRGPLILVTAFMAAFSMYLVGVLISLQTICAYCLASAFMSFALFAIVQRATEGAWRPTLAAIAAAGLAASISFSHVQEMMILDQTAASIAQLLGEQETSLSTTTGKESFITFAPPDVETPSTPRTLRLATHLKKTNAKIYGAYWCSHCFHQKEIFGKDAANLLTYVECAPDGDNSNRALCQANDLKGYPTWEINGKFYPGEKSIIELEALSGLDPPPS